MHTQLNTITDSGSFRSNHLQIRGPLPNGNFDIYEAVDIRNTDFQNWVYSCVAIYRDDYPNDWPALGGTRWYYDANPDRESSMAEGRRTALELAMSMHLKNRLLRLCENSLIRNHIFEPSRPDMFGWQGGKGIIWTPYDRSLTPEENKRRFLTPRRLLAHGRLINYIAGEYIGSKDQGIGTIELKWIEKATRYTIGLANKVDTGKMTAYGVLAGLNQAVLEYPDLISSPEQPLKGRQVLVIGAGKVGLPLIKLLDDAGATVYVFDPRFIDARTASISDEAVGKAFLLTRALGAAVDERHLALLMKLLQQSRLFSDERSALGDPNIEIISPNGGPVEWLIANGDDDFRPRVEMLAETRQNGGALRFILGGGNDQLPATAEGKKRRETALKQLSRSGIDFVPDALVSPGGVISVSHELNKSWEKEAVRRDVEHIVRWNVAVLYETTRKLGALNARMMYQAFEKMLGMDWPWE